MPDRPNRSASSERAFSLFEVLLVISTMLALSGAAYSAAQSWGRSDLSRQADGVLHLIRQEARIAYHVGGKRSIRFIAGSNRVEIDRPNLPQKQILLAKGASFIESRFGNLEGAAEELMLRGDGTATPGSVVLGARSGRKCRLTVSLHGALAKECG